MKGATLNYSTYTHNSTIYYFATGVAEYVDYPGYTTNISVTFDSNWNKLGDGNVCNYGGTYFPTHYVVKQSVNLNIRPK
jgi:hypothetical protein